MKPIFERSQNPAIVAKEGCIWADSMVLNPAIVKDPLSNSIHMIFRASGPWPQKRISGLNQDPYPVFLGYARSDDMGRTWDVDFNRPALAPALEYQQDKIRIVDDEGNTVVNYSNGCLEDPRICVIEGEYFVTVACRIFSPGRYWAKGNISSRPEWSKSQDNPYGRVAYRNATVTVLYRLDIEELRRKNYDQAFKYVCNLTDGNVTCNRNVCFFPEKMMIRGRHQYIMLSRPDQPELLDTGCGSEKPAVVISASENMRQFANGAALHKLFFKGLFDWEETRVGVSYPPIRINEREWLLANHAIKDKTTGYTQSFMILEERENDFPEITHRCPERLIFASQPWEMPDKFDIPCIFAGGAVLLDEKLIISYGAADQKIGIAWVNFKQLVEYLWNFDSKGNHI